MLQLVGQRHDRAQPMSQAAATAEHQCQRTHLLAQLVAVRAASRNQPRTCSRWKRRRPVGNLGVLHVNLHCIVRFRGATRELSTGRHQGGCPPPPVAGATPRICKISPRWFPPSPFFHHSGPVRPPERPPQPCQYPSGLWIGPLCAQAAYAWSGGTGWGVRGYCPGVKSDERAAPPLRETRPVVAPRQITRHRWSAAAGAPDGSRPNRCARSRGCPPSRW